MKNFLKLLFLTGLVLFININENQAQSISSKIAIGDTTQVHILITLKGDRYVGRVTRIENTTVFFKFQDRLDLEFQFSEISSLNVKGQSDGRDVEWYPNERPKDFETRRAMWEAKRNQPVEMDGEENLLFAPTAYTQGKGKGEYRNTMIFYNQIEYGVAEYIDLGLDVMPLFGINIIAGKIKGAFPVSEYVNVGFGAGAYLLIQPSFFNRTTSGFTHTYGVATLGTKEKHINVGFGYAFPFDSERTDGNTVLNFGGSLRVANRWKITADIVLLGSQFNPDFYNFGASWFNQKHRVDFGVGTIVNTGSNSIRTIPFPFGAYARMF